MRRLNLKLLLHFYYFHGILVANTFPLTLSPKGDAMRQIKTPITIHIDRLVSYLAVLFTKMIWVG